MAGLAAGVDLGGTKIQTVALRAQKVAGSSRIETPRSGADDVVEAIAGSVRDSLKAASAKPSELTAVGVGSPGVVGADGSVSNSPNVPGFETGPVPFGAKLSAALDGVKVKVDNDVRVAVHGEWKRGVGRKYRNFIGVFVGTGVGGGLVLDGELRMGPRGAAGEIGHTLVKDGGRRCTCGQHGHLEAYAGRARMEETARKWREEGRKTQLFKIMEKRGRDRMTSGVIADALDDHDKVAEELIEEAVWALGIALSNAANLLDLEAIIVGGGLGDRLGKPFVDRVAAAATPRLRVPEHPPLFLTTELGDLSGAVGAAVLAGG